MVTQSAVQLGRAGLGGRSTHDPTRNHSTMIEPKANQVLTQVQSDLNFLCLGYNWIGLGWANRVRVG